MEFIIHFELGGLYDSFQLCDLWFYAGQPQGKICLDTMFQGSSSSACQVKVLSVLGASCYRDL